MKRQEYLRGFLTKLATMQPIRPGAYSDMAHTFTPDEIKDQIMHSWVAQDVQRLKSMNPAPAARPQPLTRKVEDPLALYNREARPEQGWRN